MLTSIPFVYNAWKSTKSFIEWWVNSVRYFICSIFYIQLGQSFLSVLRYKCSSNLLILVNSNFQIPNNQWFPGFNWGGHILAIFCQCCLVVFFRVFFFLQDQCWNAVLSNLFQISLEWTPTSYARMGAWYTLFFLKNCVFFCVRLRYC